MVPLGISADTAGSMVVEAGSIFIDESLPDRAKDTYHGLDGEMKCYGPWDDGNLFSRLINSEVKHEFSMERHRWYIICLLRIISGARYQHFNHFKGLPSVIYEIYGTQKCMSPHPCPGLSGRSTCSSYSLDSRIDEYLEDVVKTIEESIQQLSDLGIQGLLNPDRRHKRYWSTITNIPYLGTKYRPNDENRQGQKAMDSGLEGRYPVIIDDLLEVEADIDTQPPESEDTESIDSESLTYSSSDEEEHNDDYFENARQAIRQAFPFDGYMAEKVADYLDQLPADRRARIYGYESSSRCADGAHDSSSPTQRENPGSRKRKRVSESSSHRPAQEQEVHESDDEENQVLVDDPPTTQPSTQRFACGYNIFDPEKYGPKDMRQRAATPYKSCGGPGFMELHHYKRHLERTHKPHQCRRCGRIFKKPMELDDHSRQTQSCDLRDFQPEGMFDATWQTVKTHLKRDRRRDNRLSDEERWFLVWDDLFPRVQRPPSPYYEGQGQAPNPGGYYLLQGVFSMLLDSQRLAQDPEHHGRLMEALRDAMNRTIGPNALLAPASVPTSNSTQDYVFGMDGSAHGQFNTIIPPEAPQLNVADPADHSDYPIDLLGSEEQILDLLDFDAGATGVDDRGEYLED